MPPSMLKFFGPEVYLPSFRIPLHIIMKELRMANAVRPGLSSWQVAIDRQQSCIA